MSRHGQCATIKVGSFAALKLPLVERARADSCYG